LLKKGINIAIALPENWSVPHQDIVFIPGFNIVMKSRIQGRGGDVCFYISSAIPYRILYHLSISTGTSWLGV
jgi:hypothetical protein